jgi:hypothetical protein
LDPLGHDRSGVCFAKDREPVMSGSFNDLVSSGTSIATACVEWEDYLAIVQSVNERFGLTLTPQQDAFELFQDRIRFVAGSFWDGYEPVRRERVLKRLRELTGHVHGAAAGLTALRAGLQHQEDVEVVRLLVHAINLAHAGQHPRPREALETSLKALEGLEAYCVRALLLLEQLPAKRGQPRHSWYDEHVRLMVQVAERLGVLVTTAGDRTDDPYATPFTVLTFQAERVLPEEAWSATLAACAKRIDRSLKRLKPPLRQNSPKPDEFCRVTHPGCHR